MRGKKNSDSYAVNGNKNVFSFCLKLPKDFWPLSSRLSSFQILGPAELNAREATTVLVLGSSRRNVFVDRSSRTCFLSDKS